MSATPAPALVSVIVRTLGRGTLVRALESVAAQTYRPIEIVLVDAVGRGIVMANHRGVPVRMVRGNRLDGVAAANAGLEAAQGEWLLFLDDDDQFAPGHVADLLSAARSAGAPAAYSQTQLVDPTGSPQRIFGGGPFNRSALLASNYLAMHAVLFHRSFVEAGHRFDAAFPIFYDWDFWLQLSQAKSFAFTGRPTAFYWAASGESGGGAGPNLDREQALRMRERLMRKWGASPG